MGWLIDVYNNPPVYMCANSRSGHGGILVGGRSSRGWGGGGYGGVAVYKLTLHGASRIYRCPLQGGGGGPVVISKYRYVYKQRNTEKIADVYTIGVGMMRRVFNRYSIGKYRVNYSGTGILFSRMGGR